MSETPKSPKSPKTSPIMSTVYVTVNDNIYELIK